jgi:eukaryotic-like serine/threonine-protein kinase
MIAKSLLTPRLPSVRKRVLRLKRFLVSLALASSSLFNFAIALDSPMFRGDLSHTGAYDAAGIEKFTRVKWKFKTEGRIYSTPAIVKNTIYFGSTDHNFYAVDIAAGTLKWKFTSGSGITSSSAVEDGRVYFGSYDGNFYCLDGETGQVIWKFESEGERRYAGRHLHGMIPTGEVMPDPFDFYLSSPALWSGKVYFASGDGNIYALESASGKLAWKVKTGDVVHASPAISNGTVFIGSWDSYFYAIDASNGTVKWRFKTGEDPDIHNQVGIQSSAAIANGIVYFGCRDSILYALDAVTGAEKWRFDNKGSWVIGSPAVHNGHLYFATSDSALYYALDAKTGAQIFSLNLKWPMFSSPTVAGDMLYIGSHEDKLTAIDLTAQKPVWIFQTDGSRQNGSSYTKPDGSPDYEPAFLDSFYEDGVIGVRKMLSVGAILSSPVVVGDAIYFGSSDGNLYALI